IFLQTHCPIPESAGYECFSVYLPQHQDLIDHSSTATLPAATAFQKYSRPHCAEVLTFQIPVLKSVLLFLHSFFPFVLSDNATAIRLMVECPVPWHRHEFHS